MATNAESSSAMLSEQTVPEYSDTVTPAGQWYSYNLLMLIASLIMAYPAGLIIEYEVAKLTHPQIGFIITPVWADIIISGLVLILALTNLAVLLFVFMRHLWLRRWMIATTVIGWMLIAIQAIILNDHYLSILIPAFFRTD